MTVGVALINITARVACHVSIYSVFGRCCVQLRLLCSIQPDRGREQPSSSKTPAPQLDWVPKGHKVALFAGGCFWCMEGPFDSITGVAQTIAGYTDGQVHNPTYQAVSRGLTGHTEAIQVVYDPMKVTYKQLLDVFWRNIDPLQKNGQFCDRGSQYRSGIYAYGPNQLKLAKEARTQLQASRLAGADRNRLRRHHVLPRRRIPSRLLQEESRALQAIPQRLRSRPQVERAVGNSTRQKVMPEATHGHWINRLTLYTSSRVRPLTL